MEQLLDVVNSYLMVVVEVHGGHITLAEADRIAGDASGAFLQLNVHLLCCLRDPDMEAGGLADLSIDDDLAITAELAREDIVHVLLGVIGLVLGHHLGLFAS